MNIYFPSHIGNSAESQGFLTTDLDYLE